MQPITLTCLGNSQTFSEPDTIRVGRSGECEFTVDDPRVSRLPHLDITRVDGHWVLTDRSSGGTFAAGARIDELSLPGEHVFNLGASDGPELRIAVEADTSAAPPTVADAAGPATVALHPPTTPYEPEAVATPLLGSAPAPPPILPPPVSPPASPPASPPPNIAPPPVAPPPLPPPSTPPLGQAPPPGTPPSGQAPPPGTPPLAPPGPPGHPPAIAPVAPFDPNATVMLEERNLRLVVGDNDYNLAPGQRAVIGRGEECDITVNDPLVSRQHAVVEHNGTSWTISDMGSSRGTFIDHKRIKGTQAIQGAFHAVLGDDDAGEKIRFVTGGTHHRKASKAPLFAGLVALLAIGVAAAAFLAGRGDGGDNLPDGASNTAEQAMSARLATAFILPTDNDLNPLGFSGSGALLDQNGLILTNAHVAYAETHDERTRGRIGAPEAGLPDGDLYFVGFASEDQQDVDTWYVAEPVEVHEYHDAATIQIIEECGRGGLRDCSRDPMTSVDIEPLRIGSDSDLTVGDDLAMLGYPGLAATRRVSVANINFQSYKPVLMCDEPFERLIDSQLVCTDDDEAPEGWLNLSGEGLGPGSSGGPIVRNGRLVGITQGFRLNPDNNAVPGTDVGVPVDEIRKDLDIPDPS